MTDVTAGIVAHIDRDEAAKALHRELSDHFATGLFFDDGTLGCDYNHLHAWDSIAANATTPWCAVFEDDAEPIPELGYHLGQALFYSPAPVVSLYLGRGRPVHWQKRIANAMRFPQRPYVVATTLLHCVAIAIRTELVLELLEDARDAVGSAVRKPIDEALTEAIKNRNLPVAYTNPSLVDHDDGPSLARHNYPDVPLEARVAWRVGVRDSWVGQFSVM